MLILANRCRAVGDCRIKLISERVYCSVVTFGCAQGNRLEEMNFLRDMRGTVKLSIAGLFVNDVLVCGNHVIESVA